MLVYSMLLIYVRDTVVIIFQVDSSIREHRITIFTILSSWLLLGHFGQHYLVIALALALALAIVFVFFLVFVLVLVLVLVPALPSPPPSTLAPSPLALPLLLLPPPSPPLPSHPLPPCIHPYVTLPLFLSLLSPLPPCLSYTNLSVVWLPCQTIIIVVCWWCS